MQGKVGSIIKYLNEKKVRCTYGAIAGVLGIQTRNVSRYLGKRRPEVSWVVNSRTGEPTGYTPEETHPELYSNSAVI